MVAIEKLVPSRFKHIRLLFECCPDSRANPVLTAEDTTDGSFVTLQQFSLSSEHARVRECQQRCCLRHNDAPKSPTSGLTSPMSTPKGEPMLCDIYEIHGKGNAGWITVMEMGTATLADCSTPLPLSQKRTLFLRVARAVQTLHSAGLVHNSIQLRNIIKCSSGYKLGDFSSLQRHGEVANATGTGYVLSSPEHQIAHKLSKARKCDFATDVWCLGALLSELLLGELPVDGLCDLKTFEGAGEKMAALITRMLHADASQRPVIDVVLQEAIRELFLSDDDKHDPHDGLDFDSPVKDQRMIIKDASLKNTDLSPLHSSKASIDYCLAAPAHSEACPAPEPARRDVKRETQKQRQQEDKEGSTSSNCECRCTMQ
eukprot:TRINITY_DN407_c0_g1_i1.p1 TRINITY_DN407_c0_g1~~TRINITY_DN407_c0_g1_i1.p1  ORF type:complete len:372 (-),score=58.46 TRINITY_DN407_c0_g1_i1:263-1378(-)